MLENRVVDKAGDGTGVIAPAKRGGLLYGSNISMLKDAKKSAKRERLPS